MGAYIFKPVSVFAKDSGSGIWRNTATDSYPNPSSDANLVAGFAGTSFASAVIHQHTGGPSTDPDTGYLTFLGGWYLDGSGTPIDINHLPAGFTISSANFLVKSTPNWDFDATTHYYVTYANVIETEITPHPSSDTYSIAIPHINGPLSIDSFLKFRLDHPVAGGNLSYYNLSISGNYSIVSFSYTYNVPTTAVNTIGPNNLIKITSSYPAGGSLNLTGIVTNGIDPTTGAYSAIKDTGIAGIGLVWINLAGVAQRYFIPLRYIGIEFIKRGFDPISPTLLEFEIPPALSLLLWKDPTIPGWPDVPLTPYVYGDGTQFSGWVSLTSLTITVVDASGVYTLVKDKTNDTLYDQIAPLSTSNVKIPNPYFRTGFIGG